MPLFVLDLSMRDPLRTCRGRGSLDGHDDTKVTHGAAKKKRFGSVEEEALQTYAALKKAEKMKPAKKLAIAHYGMNAWQDVLRIQAEIRKARLLKNNASRSRWKAYNSC